MLGFGHRAWVLGGEWEGSRREGPFSLFAQVVVDKGLVLYLQFLLFAFSFVQVPCIISS